MKDLTQLGTLLLIGALFYYFGTSMVDSMGTRSFLAFLFACVAAGAYGLQHELSKIEDRLTKKIEDRMDAATSSADWED